MFSSYGLTCGDGLRFSGDLSFIVLPVGQSLDDRLSFCDCLALRHCLLLHNYCCDSLSCRDDRQFVMVCHYFFVLFVSVWYTVMVCYCSPIADEWRFIIFLCGTLLYSYVDCYLEVFLAFCGGFVFSDGLCFCDSIFVSVCLSLRG